MNGAVSAVFGISVTAMCWCAFIWPFVLSTDGNDPLFRIICISTLWCFFVSLVVLLVIRARTLRQESQEID